MGWSDRTGGPSREDSTRGRGAAAPARSLLLAITGIATVTLLASPGSAGAVNSCTFNATTHVVTIQPENFGVLSRDTAVPGRILFNSTECFDGMTAATVNNADSGHDHRQPCSRRPEFTINRSNRALRAGVRQRGQRQPQRGRDRSRPRRATEATSSAKSLVRRTTTPTGSASRASISTCRDPTTNNIDVTGPSGMPLTNYVERFRVIPGTSNDIVTGSPRPTRPARCRGQGPPSSTATVENDTLTGGAVLLRARSTTVPRPPG